MPRRPPVALSRLIDLSPDANLDAAVVLAVTLGARAAHTVHEDTGIPAPVVWESLRRLIEWEYVTPPHHILGMAPTRRGETVARAVYDTRTFTFIPPQAAPELGGAAASHPRVPKATGGPCGADACLSAG